jgi:catalase
MAKKAPSNGRKPAQLDDQTVMRDDGGETHQLAGDPVPVLTTQQGIPVADDQNSLKVGLRGPTALEDFHFREKLFHFDHERIPERVVHARGFGAHGFFETYESLSELTRADVFQRAGERTPAFVRFSTVAGSKGSADLARDVRGFAVKLYTKQGNWDLVGNNIPVFFIQDELETTSVGRATYLPVSSFGPEVGIHRRIVANPKRYQRHSRGNARTAGHKRKLRRIESDGAL